jgi:hypothetical protein
VKDLIKENFDIARSKGFYPEGSNINKHLVGLISELYEAYEAHRKGHFSKCYLYSLEDMLIDDEHEDIRIFYFKEYIKDSFEDEVTDFYIRCLNLLGFLKADIDKYNVINTGDKFGDLENDLFYFTKKISDIDSESKEDVIIVILEIIMDIKDFCKVYEIPLSLHASVKTKYNKTRERLHGKKY